MSYICSGCNVGYPSPRGLERHETQCILKMQQQTIPENAYEIYKKKKARKRQEILELKQRQSLPNNLPLSALPHVRPFSLFDPLNSNGIENLAPRASPERSAHGN